MQRKSRFKKYFSIILIASMVFFFISPALKSFAESDPITLNSISVSENTATLGDEITVTANITDSVSRINTVDVVFESPKGETYPVQLTYNPNGGEYTGTFDLWAFFDDSSDWNISEVYIQDNPGNTLSVFNGNGTNEYNVEYEDLSQCDIHITPSFNLNNIAISQSDVDTEVQLKVSANITDVDPYAKANAYVEFQTQQGTTESIPLGYNANEGDYEGTSYIENGALDGKWSIKDVGMSDDEGNKFTIYNGTSTDSTPLYKYEDLSQYDFIVKTPPDTTPPTTSLNLINGWYKSSVTGTFTATDKTSGVKETLYQINNGPWQIYNSPFTLSDDGVYTINFYSVDNAGNQESTETRIIEIDKTAPTTTASGISDNWSNQDQTITLSATDSVSGVNETQYELSDGIWRTYTGQITISTEGYNELTYHSMDNADNVESFQIAYVKIDKTAPTTTASGISNSWSNQSATITLNAADNLSGVAKTQYQLNNGGWQTYKGPFTISTEGNNKLDYRSIDNAGNVETTHTTYVKIDKTVPTTTASLSKTSWTAGNVSVSLNATDQSSGISKIQYQINSGAWQTYNNPLTISTEGQTKVNYRSLDNAGNAEVVKTTTVKIDRTAPKTTASSVSSNWYKGNVSLKLTASDSWSGVSKTEYKVNTGQWTTYKSPITISSNGINTVEYRSIDNAGNVEAIKTATVKVDKTAPTLTFSFNHSVLAGKTHKMVPIQVKVSAKDSLSGISSYKLVSITTNQVDKVKGKTILEYSNAKFGSADTSFDVMDQQFGKSERIYKVTYEAIDKAGNTVEKSENIIVK
jgi:hypothetical protein